MEKRKIQTLYPLSRQEKKKLIQAFREEKAPPETRSADQNAPGRINPLMILLPVCAAVLIIVLICFIAGDRPKPPPLQSSIAEHTTTLPQNTESTTTSATVIFTSPVDETSDNGGANVENRETSVLTVNNEELHRGSVVLIDADHQQTFNPSLVTFADMKVPHLRFTSTYLQYDSSMSEDLKRWIADFFAATGHGNIMVYSTNQQPQKAVSAVVPYGIEIPERSTGLTLDLAILDEVKKTHTPYTPDGDYAWLSEHAAEYGFIVRYPEGKNDQTGLEGKTWHFRYVGIPHALYMKENDLTLEEYLEKISVHTWEKEHLTATAGGVTYEMYYVPASETAATTDIQYPVGATPVVSGDNIEGFVVSCVKQ